MSSLEFVDVETARNATGVRLVLLAHVQSPWSQAAKAIYEYKAIPGRAVLMTSRDEAVRNWTGISNAPVVMFEQETPRSGWAEILGLAERLRPDLPLIPESPQQRVLHQGLCLETMGEGGLAWNARVLAVDASLTSEGVCSFPLQAARYLAKRYGHTPGCAAAARARVVDVLKLLESQLRASRELGHQYVFGATPCAIDFYATAVMDMLVPLPPEQCPSHPSGRLGFDWLHTELQADLPPELIAHRDHMHAAHVPLPLRF